MKNPWQLYHWHFEISAKCTLQCPRCPRNDTAKVPWFNKEISLDQFKRILTPDLLKNDVKRLTMCGTIGDPIYANDYIKIIDYVKSQNEKIHVYTITNGSHKKVSWWSDFASVCNQYDTINFSVDGFDNASNNLYRINSDWDSIMTGMDIMCRDTDAFVYWATIVFNFNQDHLSHMKQMATNMGCDGMQLTYSTKFGSKYPGAYGGDEDSLEPRPEFISKSHRYERYLTNLSGRVQHNADYLEHNSKKFFEIKKEFNDFITPMCYIGNRGLFVGADSVLYPCSWVSFPYESLSSDRKTIHFKDSFHQKYRDKFDLSKRSLEEVLTDDTWLKLTNTFNNPSTAWVECEQKCCSSRVDYDYGVGYLTD
jgi:MoaA/NifB/PqqE/SkfB family radical SAM enzyme